jgi:hypothetical protein
MSLAAHLYDVGRVIPVAIPSTLDLTQTILSGYLRKPDGTVLKRDPVSSGTPPVYACTTQKFDLDQVGEYAVTVQVTNSSGQTYLLEPIFFRVWSKQRSTRGTVTRS